MYIVFLNLNIPSTSYRLSKMATKTANFYRMAIALRFLTVQKCRPVTLIAHAVAAAVLMSVTTTPSINYSMKHTQ